MSEKRIKVYNDNRCNMNTEVIKIDKERPDKDALKKAADIIKKGGLVAFPTETVYGLAADYLNKAAVERLYNVKNRPKDKPFTVHISRIDELKGLSCQTTLFSESLMKEFWPGPLTLVFASASGGKIGVRMPANRIAFEFIDACGSLVVAPSANISGNRPPCDAEDVLRDLDGKIDMLLDGGRTQVGAESTVVDVSGFPYRILRRGAIDSSRIADIGREAQHTYL